MGKRTPLYAWHVAKHGMMVDFAGWEMPLHYGSQLNEHHAVRQQAGLFDVSHMAVIDLQGHQTRAFLQHVLANDVAKLTTPGKALYTCLLNEKAGILDDLIVYFLAEDRFRLVVNAGTRDKDFAWLSAHAKAFQVALTMREDLAMLAVQGPQAIALTQTAFQQAGYLAKTSDLLALRPFSASEHADLFIARTGYTGEDGVEIILPTQKSTEIAELLCQQGVTPCGLGARDTLRLEAGLNLYGTDMNEETHPLESNLAWTIAWEPCTRDFIGRSALEAIKKQGSHSKLVGLKLLEPGVMRGHQKVMVPDIGEGEITSGGFSPTLNVSIALARVPSQTATTCMVDIRGKWRPAQVVKPVFVRHGKALVE